MTEQNHWRTRLKATLAEELQRDAGLLERLERILADSPIENMRRMFGGAR